MQGKSKGAERSTGLYRRCHDDPTGAELVHTGAEARRKEGGAIFHRGCAALDQRGIDAPPVGHGVGGDGDRDRGLRFGPDMGRVVRGHEIAIGRHERGMHDRLGMGVALWRVRHLFVAHEIEIAAEDLAIGLHRLFAMALEMQIRCDHDSLPTFMSFMALRIRLSHDSRKARLARTPVGP